MPDERPLTSTRPYLLRAFYDWINDNGLTPHLVVNADLHGVDVPRQYVQDGRITLNVSPAAAQGLVLGNDEVAFSARFSGRPIHVTFPVQAVVAVYARENGQGMVFSEEPGGPPPGGGGEEKEEKPRRGDRSHLKVVK
jgi:stringent starvation protein B